jgi:hypothetical protein
MGHAEDARVVLVEKEVLQRWDEGKRLLRRGGTLMPARLVRWALAFFFLNLIVGFGYRPIRALGWALFFIGLSSWAAHWAWRAGDMAPNSAIVLVSDGWKEALDANPANPAALWSSATGKGRDYETFHPLAWSFDVFVPLVDIGQKSAWAPSTSRGPWGRFLWWWRWVLEVTGWIVTALGAAAITGLIRRE